MIQTLTIQIARPDFTNIPKEYRKQIIQELANEIATQIVKQEELRARDETIRYWQQKILSWEVEDLYNEARYGKQPSQS